MIDRKQIKERAKSAMVGRKPSVYLVTFVFLAITFVLSNLNSAIQLGNVDYAALLEDAMMGIEPRLPEVGFLGSLLVFLIGIMSAIIEVGYRWYSLRVSRGEQAGIGDIFDAFGIFFKIVWLNIVMGVFVMLWSLLFIIPGIIAAYRYYMAVYILLDDPDKGALQCIRESKAMMRGHKWELFVLELSFIGWNILTMVPFVSLYVTPYFGISLAMYYNELSGWRAEALPAGDGEFREPWEQ